MSEKQIAELHELLEAMPVGVGMSPNLCLDFSRKMQAILRPETVAPPKPAPAPKPAEPARVDSPKPRGFFGGHRKE